MLAYGTYFQPMPYQQEWTTQEVMPFQGPQYSTLNQLSQGGSYPIAHTHTEATHVSDSKEDSECKGACCQSGEADPIIQDDYQQPSANQYSNMDKILDSFQQLKAPLEKRDDRESTSGSSNKELLSPKIAVDITKILPFMELRHNIDDLEEEEVVFKSRVKYQTAIFKNKKFRGSKFRGVSRNGKLWQVLIMIKNKKRYVGSYTNENEAAKAYDFTSI